MVWIACRRGSPVGFTYRTTSTLGTSARPWIKKNWEHGKPPLYSPDKHTKNWGQPAWWTPSLTRQHRLGPQLRWMKAKRTDALTTRAPTPTVDTSLERSSIPKYPQATVLERRVSSAPISNPKPRRDRCIGHAPKICFPQFNACCPWPALPASHTLALQESGATRTPHPAEMECNLPEVASNWKARGPRPPFLEASFARRQRSATRRVERGYTTLPALPSRCASGTRRRKAKNCPPRQDDKAVSSLRLVCRFGRMQNLSCFERVIMLKFP